MDLQLEERNALDQTESEIICGPQCNVFGKWQQKLLTCRIQVVWDSLKTKRYLGW